MAEDGMNGTLGGAPGAADNPAGGGTDSGQGGPDWGFLPDGLQSLKEGFETPENFWADISNLSAMGRERQAITGAKPESLVTDEDWNNFWKAAGRPDDPDGYKLPEQWQAEGVAPEVAEAVNGLLKNDMPRIKAALHACNLTGKQAESMMGVIGGLLAENIQGELASRKAPEETIAELWPQETSKHLDAARRGARHAGLGEALDQAGLSENPLVLKLAHALGEAIGEGGAPGLGNTGMALPSGERAREEMYRIISSDAYRNNDPEAIRKVEALSARVDM